MMIGDIVTIVVDNPAEVDDKYNVKNQTGVIVDFDEESEERCWQINVGGTMPSFWYAQDEFRLATEEECKAKLRSLLM